MPADKQQLTTKPMKSFLSMSEATPPKPLEGSGFKSFFHKWLNHFAQIFEKAGSETAAAEAHAEAAAPKKAFSLAITKILNLLYWPFFVCGIAFILWILCDFTLPYVLDPSKYAAFKQSVAPWESIIGSAAIGFWTNWLAIKMILHPRKRNLVWQGLIPARRDELVKELAGGISEKLFSGSIAREALQQSGLLRDVIDRFVLSIGNVTGTAEFRDDLRQLIKHEVAKVLEHPDTKYAIRDIAGNIIDNWGDAGLEGWIIKKIKPLIRTWIQDQVVNTLPSIPDSMGVVFEKLDEALDALPSYLARESAGIETTITTILEKGLELIDVEAIISTQLSKMDEKELEDLLTGNISVEIRFIQTSGGIFGALVAFAVQLPILRPVLLFLGLGLWGLYRVSVGKN